LKRIYPFDSFKSTNKKLINEFVYKILANKKSLVKNKRFYFKKFYFTKLFVIGIN
jgi:hypothetical protein